MTVQELNPARIYDQHFVPALFAQWGDRITRLADIGEGHRVLDVATGTGVLALAAVAKAGSAGAVTGLDINPEMLAVAREKSSQIRWCQGAAEQLEFADASFDRVVSQFGFMFFEDPVGALREMMRVLCINGSLTVAVCDALDHSPGYAVFAELLQRLFGQAVSDAFRAPFVCGDRQRLLEYARQAGIRNPVVERHDGVVCFPSVHDMVSTERACAWTLGGILDSKQFERLLAEAEESLQPFCTTNGDVRFTMPTLVLRAQKQEG